MTTTLTMPGAVTSLQVGDVFTIASGRRPWWRRLWAWLRREPKPEPQTFVITDVVADTVTIRDIEGE